MLVKKTAECCLKPVSCTTASDITFVEGRHSKIKQQMLPRQIILDLLCYHEEV